jgi:hypothetical protein
LKFERIERLEQIAGSHTFAAYDQRIFAAELCFNAFDRLDHCLGVAFIGEVQIRFIAEWWQIHHTSF